MLKIKRIGIMEGEGHCGDKVYPFVSKVLKRRYGNACTFCFDWEMEDIIKQFKEAGFTAYDDNYNIPLTEPSDYEVGKTVYCESWTCDVPMLVKDIETDENGKKIAKIKYVEFPRKHAIRVYAMTDDDFRRKVSHYGEGTTEAYDNRKMVIA